MIKISFILFSIFVTITFFYSYQKTNSFIGVFYQGDKGTPYMTNKPCSVLKLEKNNIFICKSDLNETLIRGKWWYYTIGIEEMLIMKNNDCFEILTPQSPTHVTNYVKPRNCINALKGFNYYRLNKHKDNN